MTDRHGFKTSRRGVEILRTRSPGSARHAGAQWCLTRYLTRNDVRNGGEKVQESQNVSMTRPRHRAVRGAMVMGLAIALTGGMIAQVELIPAAQAAMQATPAATGADCHTEILGDQTTSSLVDISAFIPVTDLITGAAASSATNAAGTSPSPAAATPQSTAPSVATPLASPVASATTTSPASTATTSTVDQATADDLQGLAFAIVNCTSQSQISTLETLVTDTLLSQVYAGGDALSHEDLIAIASVTVVPQQQLLAFDNLQQNGDSVSAEVIYTSGNQLLHERWTFVKDASGSGWVLDTEETLPALTQAGASVTTVTIRDNGLKANPREVKGPNVVIHSTNGDKVAHEVLVLRLPAGATTDLLLEEPGPNLPDGVDFIGQVTVPAGGEALLPLIDLPAGNYVVVDMLLDGNGTPYLANGYKARLIVQ